MPTISPVSEISPSASIAEDVEIGPFCVVGPNVKLGPGCRLHSHVVVTGHTTVGANCSFYPHCVIGADPQDKKFHGETTYLEIGDNNQFRESVSIHTGTKQGGRYTRIGHRNLIMGTCHVAHDCQIGNDCILANGIALAGHCVLGNGVNIGGLTGTHHYVTIGDYTYIAGLARIQHDLPPYVRVDHVGRERSINIEGLRRAGFDPADIEALTEAWRKLFVGRKPLAVAMTDFVSGDGLNPHVKKLLDALHRRSTSKYGRYLESQRPPESFWSGAKK
ncbi:MAG TPA: acyl-ACP--UDP-N-acetylglucosamine O-acyltransferase [Tepidisphaeraceae bacterium]|nr:acyl-ACP--UDP-N-acetylglucosamine O-acyltransferase [Tepidisphaeraceae bacterium]